MTIYKRDTIGEAVAKSIAGNRGSHPCTAIREVLDVVVRAFAEQLHLSEYEIHTLIAEHACETADAYEMESDPPQSESTASREESAALPRD